MPTDDPQELRRQYFASLEQKQSAASGKVAPRRRGNKRAILVLVLVFSVGVAEHFWRQSRIEQNLLADVEADRRALFERKQDFADMDSFIEKHARKERDRDLLKLSQIQQATDKPDAALVTFQSAQMDMPIPRNKRPLRSDEDDVLDKARRQLDSATNRARLIPDEDDVQLNLALSLQEMADLLRQQSSQNNLETALAYYQRSHGILERLLFKNPNSAATKLHFATSLIKQSTLLFQRWHPGDAELAYQYVTDCEPHLKQAQELGQEVPGYGTKFMKSILELGDEMVRRGAPDIADQCIKIFNASLEKDRELLISDPGSLLITKRILKAHLLIAFFHHQRQREAEVKKQEHAGFELLQTGIKNGFSFDAEIMGFYRLWQESIQYPSK